MPEVLKGYGILLGYFLLCVAGAFALRQRVKVPTEVFRKTLHVILLGSIFIFTYAFETWWISAVSAIAFIVMVFPILAFAERLFDYSRLLVERERGEIKRSLIVAFSMFAVLICVCWGWLEQKYLVIASVMAWGLGDAAAALIGKHYGQNFIVGKLVEGRKSVEGTLAMFAVSFVSVLVVLLASVSLQWYAYFPVAILTAAVCAVVELYTLRGMDTLTCPFWAALTMIILLHLLGV